MYNILAIIVQCHFYGKNDFAEVSKNFGTNLKRILLDYQNNRVENMMNSSMMSNIVKRYSNQFDHLT